MNCLLQQCLIEKYKQASPHGVHIPRVCVTHVASDIFIIYINIKLLI